MHVTIRPMGEAALLVETGSLADALAADAIIRSAVDNGQLPILTDQIPAARTVLLLPAADTDITALRNRLESLCADENPTSPTDSTLVTAPVVISVHYDGADLGDVAEHTGLSVGEVIAAHTGSDWRVAFGGFAPGFGYLYGGDPRLHVGRRAEPRSSIPAGSVGLAGEFSGVYPRASPGGWQLIGRTELPMWNVDRDPPALLWPGRVVRFESVHSDG